MTLCDDVRARLALFVGGDLEPDQAEGVRAHLALSADWALSGEWAAPGAGPEGEAARWQARTDARGCRACLQALVDLTRVRGRLLELAERSPAPTVELWPALRPLLEAEELLQPGIGQPGVSQGAGRPSAAPRAAGRLLSWPRIASAAAALALVALGLQLLAGEPPSAMGSRPGQVAGEGPAPGGAVAGRGLVGPVLAPVAGPGKLRRLEPGEEPLHSEALPFVDWMNGWPRQPGRLGVPVDPSRPTLASDRSLR